MLLDAIPTEEQTLAKLSPPEQRLRFLTQYCRGLQGLRMLPFAIGLILVAQLPAFLRKAGGPPSSSCFCSASPSPLPSSQTRCFWAGTPTATVPSSPATLGRGFSRAITSS